MCAGPGVLGKVLGGGLPLAAVAGSRRLLEQLAPVGDTYQAGTLPGNPLATAAGIATLGRLDAGAYERLGQGAERLEEGAAAGVPVQVPRATGLLSVFFAGRPVSVLQNGARDSDAAAFAKFFNEMLARGIYLPPSPSRGLVSVAGARGRPPEPHGGSGERSVRGVAREA